MALLRIPSGFDATRPGATLPKGQTLETTAAAQRAARSLEERVEKAVTATMDLDNVDGVDLNPEPGVVEVKDRSWKWMKLSGTLTFDVDSRQVEKFDATVGSNEYRVRDHGKIRIYEWNDENQMRKLTENRGTGTLTLFQG